MSEDRFDEAFGQGEEGGVGYWRKFGHPQRSPQLLIRYYGMEFLTLFTLLRYVAFGRKLGIVNIIWGHGAKMDQKKRKGAEKEKVKNRSDNYLRQ